MGSDSLTGGAGSDTLTGGAGADKFIFSNVSDFASGITLDTIAEFHHAEADRIDLSGVDADSTLAGNQAFIFIGAAAFDHHPGELSYTVNGGGVVVQADINGDGVADFSFNVLGVSSLLGADFIL
jgi:Ca2+-binding RTX toxin-like protein